MTRRHEREAGLGKTFNHWLRKEGIRPISRFYSSQWQGKGRRFRVTNDGCFEMSDNDFDRWANSRQLSFPIPKTKKEMDAVIFQCKRQIALDKNKTVSDSIF